MKEQNKRKHQMNNLVRTRSINRSTSAPGLTLHTNDAVWKWEADVSILRYDRDEVFKPTPIHIKRGIFPGDTLFRPLC